MQALQILADSKDRLIACQEGLGAADMKSHLPVRRNTTVRSTKYAFRSEFWASKQRVQPGRSIPNLPPPLKGNGPAWLACYEKSQYEFLNLKNVTSHKPQTPCEVFVLGTSYICHAYFSGTPASHCDWEATGWRSLTGSVVADIEEGSSMEARKFLVCFQPT
jgi:hypothetical protein